MPGIPLTWDFLVERVRVSGEGIEPPLSAWEVSVTIRGLPADTLACGTLASLTASDRELPPGLIQSGTYRARRDGAGFTDHDRWRSLGACYLRRCPRPRRRETGRHPAYIPALGPAGLVRNPLGSRQPGAGSRRLQLGGAGDRLME
jgi:hypothetical protein